MKRAVWERDQGRCTFVSEAGTRCSARTRLEFDHIEEVARGGKATVSGIRLLCRAHNQYMAERTFGAEFMRHKRAAATEARAAAGNGHGPGLRRAAIPACDRATAEAQPPEASRAPVVRSREQAGGPSPAVAEPAAAERARALDVVPWLRALGFSASQARSAAAVCGGMPDATLEERVKAALSYFRPRGSRILRPASPGTPGSPAVAGSLGGG